MGRSKSYQRQDVIAQAQMVFWSKGWEATSLQDLEAATGLNKFSLYSEFGSKRGLFMACLEAYVSGLLLPVFEAFDPAAPDGPVAFLYRVADQLKAYPRLGCFLLNASQETGGKETEFDLWSEMTYGRLRQRLSAHWKDPRRAQAFVLTVQGLMVSGRMGTDSEHLHQAIQGLAPLFREPFFPVAESGEWP